jgi:hypothetical protein
MILLYGADVTNEACSRRRPGQKYGGSRMHFLRYLAVALVVAALGRGFLPAQGADDQPPDLLIGYSEFRQPAAKKP